MRGKLCVSIDINYSRERKPITERRSALTEQRGLMSLSNICTARLKERRLSCYGLYFYSVILLGNIFIKHACIVLTSMCAVRLSLHRHPLSLVCLTLEALYFLCSDILFSVWDSERHICLPGERRGYLPRKYDYLPPDCTALKLPLRYFCANIQRRAPLNTQKRERNGSLPVPYSCHENTTLSGNIERERISVIVYYY